MPTLAEQLTSVQTAIAAIEGGAQTITAEDGRTYKYPDLKTLYAREKRLQDKIAFETTHGRTVAEF